MTEVSLILTALLFGGMTFYSFGFAAFLFTALPAETAGPTIRRAFPHFYLFVIVAAGIGAVPAYFADPMAAAFLAGIALTTIPTRQMLMPAINNATDAGNKKRFAVLHGFSVLITLAHIVFAAWTILRLAA